MHLLHLHSSFDPGGKELRAVRLMNLIGPAVRHSIVSAQPGATGARAALDPGLDVAFPADFPALAGRPALGRLHRLARAMAGYDLVLSYNWGAMDAVLAHTLFARTLSLPPLVHHEDGFNADEAQRLKPARNWYRRIALGRSAALVVPSERLERVALEVWQQPRRRVVRIGNGIPTADYAQRPRPDAIPRVIKRPGECWVGTLAGLRTVKNLPRLVSACAGLPEHWQLVILGDGPERDAIRARALELGIGHRVHMPGFVPRPAEAIGLFDIFALSSDSEQFPISVVEAMAAGLPVASPAVGDVASMVASENRPFVVEPGQVESLAAALIQLATDAGLRQRVGAANAARARRDYDEATMLAAYRQVYGTALGITAFP